MLFFSKGAKQIVNHNLAYPFFPVLGTGHTLFFGFWLARYIICVVYDWPDKIERITIECRKTKTKIITLANHKGRRQSSEPIKTPSNYI